MESLTFLFIGLGMSHLELCPSHFSTASVFVVHHNRLNHLHATTLPSSFASTNFSVFHCFACHEEKMDRCDSDCQPLGLGSEIQAVQLKDLP